MEYIGDFNTGATVRGMWNSNAVAGGSVTRATNGSIRIYKNNSTTERTSSAGITDTEDFDSLTGVHHVNIDLSDNTDSGFYAAGNDYFVVLSGATIDGQSINAYLFCFSIENRNIKANVTQFGGSNGTFSSGRPEVNASYVGGSAVASGVLPNVAAGTTGGLILIGTGTRDINPNAGGVVITSTDKQAFWDILTSAQSTSGSIGKAIADNLTGNAYTIVSNGTYGNSALNTLLGTIAGYVDTEVAAIKAKTDNLPSAFPTNFADLAITATTGRVTVGTNNDKTGYSLTQTFPANFADLAITSSTGLVTVGTNNDKTGYTCSSIGSGAITTSSFAAGAIDAAAIATDAIGSLELAAGAATEIATAVASAVSTAQTRCRVEAAMTSSAGSEVRMLAWLERNGERVVLPSGTCSIEVREHGSGSALFTATDSAPNARGVFELTQSSPGFTNDRLYAATVTIVDDSAVSHVTIEAFPVFG